MFPSERAELAEVCEEAAGSRERSPRGRIRPPAVSRVPGRQVLGTAARLGMQESLTRVRGSVLNCTSGAGVGTRSRLRSARLGVRGDAPLRTMFATDAPTLRQNDVAHRRSDLAAHPDGGWHPCYADF